MDEKGETNQCIRGIVVIAMNQPKIFLAIAVCCLAALVAVKFGCRAGGADESKRNFKPTISLVKENRSTGINTWRINNLGLGKERAKTRVVLLSPGVIHPIKGPSDSIDAFDSLTFDAKSVCGAKFIYHTTPLDTVGAEIPQVCEASKIDEPWKLVQGILKKPMGPLSLSALSEFQLSYNGETLNPVEFGIEARMRFLNGDPMTMEEPDPVSFAANPVIQLK